MIEQPLLTPRVLSSRDNLLEVLRRVRARVRSNRNVQNKLTVSRDQYERYFKFTIVRNPWSRVFSAYQNVVRDEVHRRKHGVDSHISLRDYLRQFAGRRLIKPQTYYIRDFGGSIPLDFIGRFESLAADFEKACGLMGMASAIPLPHEIKGTVGDYRSHFDPVSVDIVHRVYREEIRLFDYDF